MEIINKHLNNLLEKVNTAKEIINKAAVDLNGEKMNNEFKAVFLNLLLRQIYLLEGVFALFGKTNKHYWKFPISIILRVGLTDYIILNYLLSFAYDEALFKKKYESLSRQLLKTIQNEIEPQMVKDVFDNHFTSLSSDLKDAEHLTIKDMASVVDPEMKIYTLYQKFSQYEHFNKFSVSQLEQDFMSEDLNDFYFSIYWIFNTAFQVIQLLIIDKNYPLLKNLDRLCTELEESRVEINEKYKV